MIIKNKKKIILITLVILLFIIAITLLVLNQTGVINTIIENINKEEIKKEISYEVYKHVNGQTAMLLVAEDTENGIEKIIYPNNEMEIYCNGKTKVAFDYNTDITGKESLTFKLVNTLGEEIEKTIKINDQFYFDLITYNLTNETEAQKALTVNYKTESTTKQYKVGDNSAWVNYGGAIRLDDYQIMETIGKEINVYLRQIDNMGYEIVTKLKYTIDEDTTYKQEDTVIEGESILACVENNDLTSGNYIFRVTYTEEGNTIDYPVELYNYNENANYIANNIAVIAGSTYTGMGKIGSEKRMLVLKYNGDLTINSGVTITPTGTNASINGATYLCTKKGMFIYCAGTLTNNGTITMTAKGTVNQSGENVYLYKNEDNTYEYVPAVGGAGGATVTSTAGKNGATGTGRRTGGGGSGGAYQTSGGGPWSISGAGSTGTSYSGGAGGGSVYTNGHVKKYAGNGGSNGGLGGNAAATSSDNVGGGAGNPGGKGIASGKSGEKGTGGLLILYTNDLNNNGSITSNGSNGGAGYWTGGGASGGGSINIFYRNNIPKGTITAIGGNGGYASLTNSYGAHIGKNGGNGGAGSTTIGNISTGTFVKDK